MPHTSRLISRQLFVTRREGTAGRKLPIGVGPRPRGGRYHVDHIITLGWRGAPDARIRARLSSEVIFLTQDEDFLFGESVAASVVVSRVRQSRRLADRVEVWRKAVGELLRIPRAQRLFELTDEGALVPSRDGGSRE